MIIFCIVFGLISVTIGLIALTYADKIGQYLCSVITVCFGVFMVYTGFILMGTTTYYLEAEGIYPENTYLLTMNNNGTSDKEDDIVLVVWEPSEGEVG